MKLYLAVGVDNFSHRDPRVNVYGIFSSEVTANHVAEKKNTELFMQRESDFKVIRRGWFREDDEEAEQAWEEKRNEIGRMAWVIEMEVDKNMAKFIEIQED